MNKVEEILQSKETYDPEYPTISISDALEAMKEFGKICFEVGTKNGIKTADKRWLDKNQFIKPLLNYEEFLKEIKNEADNND